jgi:hypothetical protein
VRCDGGNRGGRARRIDGRTRAQIGVPTERHAVADRLAAAAHIAVRRACSILNADATGASHVDVDRPPRQAATASREAKDRAFEERRTTPQRCGAIIPLRARWTPKVGLKRWQRNLSQITALVHLENERPLGT